MHQDAGSSVADVYAEALYDAALAAGAVPRIEDELLAFQAAFDRDPRFERLLDSPSIPLEDKRRVLAAALAGFHALSVNFLSVVVERQRLEVLAQITAAFRRHCNHKAGIAELLVATARPLEPAEEARLREMLERCLGRRVLLTQECRPELLGGLVLTHEDRRWNASLVRRLQGLMDRVARAESGLIFWSEA